DRKSTRLNSSHSQISYAVFCLKKKNDDARISGALEHDELTGAHVRTDRARGGLDVRHVGFAVRVERRRDAQYEDVRLARLAQVHRRREALVLARVLLLDPARVDVADVALALLQRGDLARVDVEPDDRESFLS